jgi:hypothetical protein
MACHKFSQLGAKRTTRLDNPARLRGLSTAPHTGRQGLHHRATSAWRGDMASDRCGRDSTGVQEAMPIQTAL